MEFKYEYKKPEDNGYTKINIPKSLHNSVFTYRKRTLLKSLFVRWEYYKNDWNIRAQVLPTILTKVLTVLFVPLILIMQGVGNYKDVFRDVYRTCNPKKTGSFSVDDIQGDKYKEVVSKLNSK